METTQRDHETQPFEMWCIVELLGHKTLAGLVTETRIAEHLFFTIQIKHVTGNRTEIFSPSAVYRIIPCTEETARVVSTNEHGCVELYDMRSMLIKNDALIASLRKADELKQKQPLIFDEDDGSEDSRYE